MKQIAGLKSVELSPSRIRSVLIALGLEVDGQVRSDLTSQAEARFDADVSQPTLVHDRTW